MLKKSQKKSLKNAGGRSRYTPKFRQEALLLAARVGVAAAVQQLGVALGLLYSWRGKARQVSAMIEQTRPAEIARLKRQPADHAVEFAIPKKAATYFARTRRCSTP